MFNNLVTLIIIFVVLFLVYLKLINAFSQEEGFSGKFYNTQDTFTKQQEGLFWNKMNKSLMTNSGLSDDMKKLDAAFQINDTFANKKNRMGDISQYFETDITPGFEKQNLQCSGVLEPRFLPNRNEYDQKGCGWWYVNDENKPSVGALGTSTNPLNINDLEKSHSDGVWMWDLVEAQKMEDIKRCRKIKTCDMADLVPGRCGFCLETSSGIPTDGNGIPIYPDDENLICPSKIITNHSQCPKPPPPPLTKQGDIYVSEPQQQTCEPNPVSGKIPNECLASWAKGVGCTPQGVLISILSGDAEGYYSSPGQPHEKFIKAKEIIKEEGSLSSLPEFFGFGTCTRNEALGYYNSLVKTASSSQNARVRAAASFLVHGGDFDECQLSNNAEGPYTLNCLQRVAREAGCQPDGTDYPSENVKKPYRNIPGYCKKLGRPSNDGNIRLYTKEECDSLLDGGNYYPSGECTVKTGGSFSWNCRELNMVENDPKSTKEKYDEMSWGSILAYFRDLYTQLQSSDKNKVVLASKKCLGIDIILPEEEGTDVLGVYYYCYRWDYDHNVSSGSIPTSTYYGRYIRNKLVEISNNGSFTPFNIGTDRIHLRIKSALKSEKGPVQTRFWVQSDDGISIRVDNKNVLQKWYDQGPTSYESYPFVIYNDKSTLFEIDWYNNYGGYVLMPRIFDSNKFITPPSSTLRLNQPSGYPFARWDFYEGVAEDRCGTLATEVIGSVPVMTIEGKKCMYFSGPNYIKITNSIAMSAVKSVTMMVCIRTPHSGWPRLWEFDNSPLGNFNGQGNGNWCQDSLFGCASPNNGLGFGFYAQRNCTGPSAWSGAGTIQTSRWYHIAWVIDASYDTMSMYINGTKSFSIKGGSQVLTKEKIYKNLYIVNSVEYFDKNIGVAWFRLFDYPLSERDVNTDRDNNFSTGKLFKKSSSSGW
jgi:hypothetical protein